MARAFLPVPPPHHPGLGRLLIGAVKVKARGRKMGSQEQALYIIMSSKQWLRQYSHNPDSPSVAFLSKLQPWNYVSITTSLVTETAVQPWNYLGFTTSVVTETTFKTLAGCNNGAGERN